MGRQIGGRGFSGGAGGGNVKKHYLSARRTSSFGMRKHPVTGVRKMHTGQDFAFKAGTGIPAVMSGVVESNVYNKAYGWIVTINHGNGIKTRYAHMQKKSPLKPGTPVVAGQIIGRVGSTGYSTGPHLHLEYIVNGKFKNPMLLFK